MGWYGDYKDTQEVIDETVLYIDREKSVVIDTKAMKTYGIILYRKEDGTHEIYSFIFGDEMYKSIYFLNDSGYFSKIPKKWLALLTTDEQKKYIAEQKEIIAKKKDAPKLDDFLEVGKVYLVWGEHKAMYQYKHKRSHVFKLRDGSMTRFRNLKISDLQEIK